MAVSFVVLSERLHGLLDVGEDVVLAPLGVDPLHLVAV